MSILKAGVMQWCFSTFHFWVCSQRLKWSHHSDSSRCLDESQVPFPANQYNTSTWAKWRKMKNVNFKEKKKRSKNCGTSKQIERLMTSLSQIKAAKNCCIQDTWKKSSWFCHDRNHHDFFSPKNHGDIFSSRPSIMMILFHQADA